MGVKAKSPVSLLQEVYVRRGMTPQYDLVQVEGEVHQPTFKYRVTVGRTLATGCGHSKKKAKHCAAKIMLDKLKHLEQRADAKFYRAWIWFPLYQNTFSKSPIS